MSYLPGPEIKPQTSRTGSDVFDHYANRICKIISRLALNLLPSVRFPSKIIVKLNVTSLLFLVVMETLDVTFPPPAFFFECGVFSHSGNYVVQLQMNTNEVTSLFDKVTSCVWIGAANTL